jgi:AAA family ATP:ADP antiporter
VAIAARTDAASPGDSAELALSCASFALLLACYYILRPVRDALAASIGADSIKFLSSAAFIVMLAMVPVFGWLVTRVPRQRLVPGLYVFFILNLGLFAWAFGRFAGSGAVGVWWASTFYVWVTVFNMFAVSVFWSRMADVWNEEQGRRYFGYVSAAGSVGGIIGPLLGRELAGTLALSGLVWISAALLAGALAGMAVLAPPARTGPGAARIEEPSGGAILDGLWLIVRTPFLSGIASLVTLGSFLGMIVYVEMARLVAVNYPNAAQRTAFYSTRDLWVNAGAFALQLLLVGRIARRLGVGPALLAAALIVLACFVVLGASPSLTTLTAVSVVLRCAEFGVGKPARDMLYTVVPTAAKYQSKNVIDTALYRGSDMASGWIQAALGRYGMSLGGWGWVGAGFASMLAAVAVMVGRGYRRRGGV